MRGRTVVIGVAGGIAAYKICELVRALKKRGAAVVVVMSEAAARFVGPLTFETLSGNPVVTDLWGPQRVDLQVSEGAGRRLGGKVAHVDVAEAADCLVLAPATADLLGRLVRGEAKDVLGAVALATPGPVVVCPSMDAQMWRNAATQENLARLRARGLRIVEPESGELASGLEGPGRLASLDAMLAEIGSALERRESLAGVKVLVSAGRTEEPLDPVRVLTNRSSGKMGYAVAAAARDRGAAVTLVSGAASVDPPEGVNLLRVASAADMERAMKAQASHADVVVMAAAVADYRPARPAAAKIRRGAEPLTLELEPNPDVLAELGRARRRGQTLVGFALETGPGLASARAKLRGKGCDLIVLNDVTRKGAEIGGDTNRVTLVTAKRAEALPVLAKREVAERILDRVLELRAAMPARSGGEAARGPRRAARRAAR
jgi:phosphopantothenoylcysteine decarboxylase/phosphopantothenate--cysteine ligase